jgi:hypothetical protein
MARNLFIACAVACCYPWPPLHFRIAEFAEFPFYYLPVELCRFVLVSGIIVGELRVVVELVLVTYLPHFAIVLIVADASLRMCL